MDLQVYAVIAIVFLVSLCSLLFINKQFRGGKTFEEVLAEKRQFAEKLYGTSGGKNFNRKNPKKLNEKNNKKVSLEENHQSIEHVYIYIYDNFCIFFHHPKCILRSLYVLSACRPYIILSMIQHKDRANNNRKNQEKGAASSEGDAQSDSGSGDDIHAPTTPDNKLHVEFVEEEIIAAEDNTVTKVTVILYYSCILYMCRCSPQFYLELC